MRTTLADASVRRGHDATNDNAEQELAQGNPRLRSEPYNLRETRRTGPASSRADSMRRIGRSSRDASR